MNRLPSIARKLLLPSWVALAGFGLLGVIGYTVLCATGVSPSHRNGDSLQEIVTIVRKVPQHWDQRTSGTNQTLFSVFGSSTGKSLWVVGDRGTILHSDDGQHWSQQVSRTNQTLISIYGSSDGKALWAVGDGGAILHSDDGQHWSQQSSGTNQALSSIFGSSDGKLLWAVGDRGTIVVVSTARIRLSN
jgi:hypothetical protein